MPRIDNTRHELFAQALAKGESASQAYVLAGYRRNDGNAIRLKGNERVAARVAELLDDAAGANLPDIARLMKELASIAFSDIGDVVQWSTITDLLAEANRNEGDTNGADLRSRKIVRIVDSDLLAPSTRAAIQEISQGRDGIRVKMHPKLPALTMLLERLKMTEGGTGRQAEGGNDLKENVIDFKAALGRYGGKVSTE